MFLFVSWYVHLQYVLYSFASMSLLWDSVFVSQCTVLILSFCYGVNSPDGQISRSNKATNYLLTNTHTYTHQPPAGFVDTESTCTCMLVRQPQQPAWEGVRVCVPACFPASL